MTITTQHHGASIPRLGFGTWKLKGDTAHHCVLEAINAGYRHIDTAQIYDNETHVGRGIADAQLPRKDLFLTTKVWLDNFRDGDLQRSVHESLERLGTDHVDLLLLHWPHKEVALEESLGALNEVKREGLTKHIGLSNFNTQQMDDAAEFSDAPLVCNQVEFHPFIDQVKVMDACRRHDMALTAYSPLAQGRVFDEPTLSEIANAHGVTPAQVVLRWMLQKPDIVMIPRSSSPEHLRANTDIRDFALSPDEMGRLDAMKQRHERLIDPDWAPDWDGASL